MRVQPRTSERREREEKGCNSGLSSARLHLFLEKSQPMLEFDRTIKIGASEFNDVE